MFKYQSHLVGKQSDAIDLSEILGELWSKTPEVKVSKNARRKALRHGKLSYGIRQQFACMLEAQNTLYTTRTNKAAQHDKLCRWQKRQDAFPTLFVRLGYNDQPYYSKFSYHNDYE